MQLHEHHEEYLVEEMRNIARRAYGPRRRDGTPVEHRLVNIERLTKLHAIAHNPYHKLVFGRMSTRDLMRICAIGLIENLDFRNAWKVLRELDRMDRADADRASPEPAASAPPETAEPEDLYLLDLEAQPVQEPPLTPHQVYLRSLSDREIARQLQAAWKREQEEP